MIRTLTVAALIGIVVGSSSPALAQTAEIKDMIGLLRSDVQAHKKFIIAHAMAMTEAEGEAFWPIYADYQDELRKVSDERLALVREYRDNFNTMTDKMASNLVKRSLKTQEARLKLYKKYNARIAKATSPKLAARWLQAENAINTIVDLQIASGLPLMR